MKLYTFEPEIADTGENEYHYVGRVKLAGIVVYEEEAPYGMLFNAEEDLMVSFAQKLARITKPLAVLP